MPNKHEPLTLVKYWVTSNIGTSFRRGLNHVVLDQNTGLYLADDVDALLGDPQALAAYLVERKKGRT